MDWIRSNREFLSVGAGLLLPLGAAAVMVPFRGSFADSAASLVLVALVAVVAIAGTRPGGYAAALSSAVWFDFFLTRPYEQFRITQRPDIEITVSLLLVGVAVTELAARSRHHLRVAEEESDYVKVIYEVSELASSGVTFDELTSRVSRELIRLLRLRECRFEAGTMFERLTVLDHDGSVHLGNVDWPVQQWGLPGQQVALMVYARGRVVGRFVLTPTVAEPVALRRRLVAVALADQVGSFMTPRLRAG